MRSTEEIVINTGPILAIVAGLGSLQILRMYRQVWVPWEVCQEVLVGGPDGFAVAEFQTAHWLINESKPLAFGQFARPRTSRGHPVCPGQECSDGLHR